MISRQAGILSGGLVLSMFLGGLWGVSQLPAAAQVALHFGQEGSPHRWVASLPGLLVVPAGAACVWVLMAVIPSIDPRGANLARSPQAYGTIWLAITALLTITEAVIVATAVGATIDVPRVIWAAKGAFLLITGNVLGKLRWNYMVGIRTPWTLADERVWDKTHRFGGRMFVLAGFLIMVSAFVLRPDAVMERAATGVVLGVVFVTVLKSYLLWRQRQNLLK